MNRKESNTRKWLTAAAVAFLMGVGSVAQADSISWVGGSTGAGTGAWATTTDWSGSKVPAAGDTVTINTGTVNLGGETATFYGTTTVTDAKLTSTATDSKNFIFPSGSMTINQTTALGDNDWNFNSGVARLFFGTKESSPYSLTLSGYAKMKVEHSTGAVRLGTAWTQQTGGDSANLSATLTVTDNAQLQINRLYLGDRGSNQSNVGTLTVKGSGSATFTATNGENCLILGNNNSKGIINLQDSGTLTTNGPSTFGAGEASGVGQMIQTGGTANFKGKLTLAKASSINVTGGTLNLDGDFALSGTSSITVSGSGTVNVAKVIGAKTTANPGSFTVGSGGTANFKSNPVGVITNNGTTNFNADVFGIGNGKSLQIDGTGTTNIGLRTSVDGTLVLNAKTVQKLENDLITVASTVKDAPGKLVINNDFTGASGAQLYVASNSGTAAAPRYGELVIKGGTVSIDYIQLARAHNFCNLDISGGTINVTNDLRIARNGTATGQMTAGNVTANFLILGHEEADSNGSFDIKGGTFTAESDIYVGRQGTGNLTVSGTTETTKITAKNINIGGIKNTDNKGTGSMTLSGGEISVDTDFYIGCQGTGSFTQSGGSLTTQFFCMGYSAPGVGNWTMTGGTLNVTANLRVGLNTPGTASLSGGTVTAANFFLTESSSLDFASTEAGFAQINATNATLAGSISLDSPETFFSGDTLAHVLLQATETYDNSAALTGNQFYDLISDNTAKTLSAVLKTDLSKGPSFGAIKISEPTDSLTLDLAGLEDSADMADFLGFLNDPANKAQYESWTATSTEEGQVLISGLGLAAGDAFLYNLANYTTPSGHAVTMASPGVPEPATLTLLLIGFLSGAFYVRRTRVQK